MPFFVACTLFLFLRGEETQNRKAEGRNASPQGGREKRDPVRRPGGLAIRRDA